MAAGVAVGAVSGVADNGVVLASDRMECADISKNGFKLAILLIIFVVLVSCTVKKKMWKEVIKYGVCGRGLKRLPKCWHQQTKKWKIQIG